jgi:hypothetical protein
MTRHVGLGRSPVGPCRRNERSAAIRQNDENEQDAASLDGVDHTESLAFEGVAPPDNGHLRRNISVMGSVAPLPSTRSVKGGWSASSSTGSVIRASSA